MLSSGLRKQHFEMIGADLGKMTREGKGSHPCVFQAIFWEQFRGTFIEDQLGIVVRRHTPENITQVSCGVTGRVS